MSWDRLVSELNRGHLTRVDGYAIHQQLGEGAFGLVYKAEREGREYAIKFLRRVGALTELANLDVLVGLEHPNLVRIVMNGRIYDVEYIVMDYAGSSTLRSLLVEEGQPLDEKRACAVFEQVLDGVGFLHSRGITHFDLKPGNVFLEEMHARIGDFGLAKLMSETLMTVTAGHRRGTASYMAPELAEGRGSQASDVYSLGIIFYELFAGKVPFTGLSEAAVLLQHREQPVIPPQQVPRRFHPFLLQSLEKDPGRRFRDANAQLRAFRHARDQDEDARTLALPARETPAAPVAGPPGPLPPGMDPRIGEVALEVREARQVAQGLTSDPASGPSARPRSGTRSVAGAPLRFLTGTVRGLLQVVIVGAICAGLGLLIHLGLEAGLR